jgi:putative NIF3 family GTP cyclohydrolase 1 type 2
MITPASAVDRVVAALVAHHPYEEPAYDVYDVRANAGFIGRHGAVKATTLGALADQAGALLSCRPRVAGASDAPIGHVAVVPGSGGSFVAEAAGVADVLVTGDVSHHQARDALDRGLSIIDVGHAPSERPGLDRLYAAVAQLGLPLRSLLELDPDPWS